MTRRRITLAGLALLPWLAANSFEAPQLLACPRTPMPADTSVSLVAENVAVNGMPMTIVEARNSQPASAFRQYFRDLWTAREGGQTKPLYVEYEVGGWQVIAHRDGSCFTTVQLHIREPNTRALVAVGSPESIQPNSSARPGVTLPGGSRLLSHMASQDRGKSGDSWVVQSGHSVLEAVRYFRESLPQQGWQRLLRKEPDSNHEVATLMYQKGTRDLGIVVQPRAGGSTLVLTEVMR